MIARNSRFSASDPLKARLLVLIGLWIVSIVAMSLLSPYFLQASTVPYLLQYVPVLGLLGLGQTLVVLAGGPGIDLSVGAIVSLVSVIVGALLAVGLNIWLACAAGLVAGALLGLINGILVNYLRIPSLMATLATMFAYGGLALATTEGRPFSNFPEGFAWLGLGQTFGIPNSFLFVLLPVAVILHVMLTRTVIGRHRRAVQVGKLLGMQLDRQAKRLGMLEDARHFLDREGDALAEPVDRVDQPFGMALVHAGDDHFVDIAGAVVLEFRRQSVGGEPGGDDMHRARLADAARDPQHLQFGGDVEPVAGLDLQRGDAFGKQRIDARQRQRQKLFLARLAGVANRRQDAAAGPRDLLVAGAFKAHLEFAGAVAAIDDVGVAVDQAGRDHAPIKVAGRRIAPGGGQIGVGADPGNGAAVDDDRGALDEAATRLTLVHDCDCGIAENLHPARSYPVRNFSKSKHNRISMSRLILALCLNLSTSLPSRDDERRSE